MLLTVLAYGFMWLSVFVVTVLLALFVVALVYEGVMGIRRRILHRLYIRDSKELFR